MSEFEHDLSGLFNTYKDHVPMAKNHDDRLWEKFRLDWNYNSNRIEGNTLTYKETKDLIFGGLPPTKPRRHVSEMKAHDLAISETLNLADSKRPITESDIRSLNKTILKEPFYRITQTENGNETRVKIMPGEYKKVPNHVLQRSGDIHNFAEPIDTPALMQAWTEQLNTLIDDYNADANSLPQILAKSHYDFIQIHPFGDGNGRTARLLLNYALRRLDWPPAIIKDAKKDDYDYALEAADDGDVKPLEAVMRSEMIWSLDKSIKAAQGQDIEDPDDIDKEISQFVKEYAAPFGTHVRTDSNVKAVHQGYTLPIMRILEQRLAQFDKMFGFYVPSLKAKDFENTINNGINSGGMPLQNQINIEYKFLNFMADRYRDDIVVHVLIKLGTHEFNITSEIRSHNHQRSKTIELPVSDYGAPIDHQAREKFTSNIGRAVLEIVKDYQQKAKQP